MITFKGGKAEGKVSPPPSKSHTHRAIIMSSLSGGKCKVSSPLFSFDTRSTMNAVRTMGSIVEEKDDGINIDATTFHAPDSIIDVGNSGTTLRLMTGISSVFDEKVTLTGDESIQKRPMGPLLDTLSTCNVKCTSNDRKPPVTVKGPAKSGILEIDGSMSSQFVSSLIMMSPLLDGPVEIIIKGELVSKPYIDITIYMMKKFGIIVKETEKGYYIEPQNYKPFDYRVPADFSSSAFPLVAGALSGSVTVCGMDIEDPQGDRRIVDVLKNAGCTVEIKNDEITCTSNGRPKHMDVDMSDIPDLFPIVAVLLSTADGTSRLYGAPHLRFKESDRIALTEKMLKTLGADITGTDDGCIINGVKKLKGGAIEHNGDHRMMMAAAIASLISDGPISMKNDECWNVSYPGFPEQMKSLGVEWE